MSVTQCILGKAASGIIDKEFAASQVKKLEQFEKQLEFYPEAPKEKALSQFANQLKHLSDVKKFQLLKEVQTQDRLLKQIAAHPQGKTRGMMAALSHDLHGRAEGLNVDKLREGIAANAFGSMPDAVARLSLKNLGFSQDKNLARDVVRAIFGSEKNELASKIGRQFSTVQEKLRLRFNAAGGDIPELSLYHLPQNHDSRLLNKVSADEWVGFVEPLLDRRAMVDWETGFPLSRENLRNVLYEAYETLRTNGLNKLEPGVAKNQKLANKYAHSRILHFKDADSWIAYNERFGNGDIYKTMVDHVNNMADDIAFLEVWGPNPDKQKKVMVDTVRKEAGLLRDPKAKNKAATEIKAFETLWKDISGEQAIPVNNKVAKVNSEIRALLTSAQLGSAFLTQFSDVTTNALTAKFNGLSAGDLMKYYLKLMSSNKYRDFSIHLGLGADEVTKVLSSSSRYAEGLAEKGYMSRVSNMVMQASLLERMTMASKKAFDLDFSKTIGDLSQKEFLSLPKRIRSCFERYGINAEDWAVIAKSKFDEFEKVKYLNLINLADENLEVANKVQNMIFTERDFAVIDSNARTRAVMLRGTEAGTFLGEALRYIGMYKTFPVTILMHHLSRMASLEGAGSKFGYALALFAPMTMAGYLTVQAKNLVNGKKPLPADDWKTWVSAAAAGGAAGILGDFLFSQESRSGNSVLPTLIGPGGSLLEDTWRITAGAAKRKLAGEDVNYPSEIIDFVKRYTPGNNLWYTKLAVERGIFDQLSLLADPGAKRRFRNIERKFNKDYGTGYWWRRGELKPDI